MKLTLQCCWWRHSWTEIGRSDHGGIPAGSVGSCRKGRWLNSDARAFLELQNKNMLQVENKPKRESDNGNRCRRRKRSIMREKRDKSLIKKRVQHFEEEEN